VEPQKTPRERAEDLINLLVPEWRPNPRQGLWAIRIAIVLGLLVAIGYAYGVTLWDWMNLLIVPAVIAAGGLWYNRQQQERQQEDDRRQQERGLEIEDQRAQDTALEAYLHQMSQLLTDKDRPLHKAQKHDSLSTVAWAWTKTVLRRIGPERKGNVLRFVNEAGLINKDRPVFSLSGADLREADLQRSVLRGDVNLPGADLSGANLSDADLSRASLIGANLHSASLGGANLSGANLRSTAGVTNDQLELQARSLIGATIPNGQKYEDWLKSKGRAEDGQNDGSS